MISGALIYLVNVAFGLFIVALLLRFYLQWARAPYRNPLAEFLQALTDFMVRPARRVVPGLWGFDLSTLVLAWLIQMVEIYVVLQLRGFTGGGGGIDFFILALLALATLVRVALYIILFTVIVQVVLSWVAPYSPLMPLANSLSRPFLRPLQKRIPPVGNVDLSPLLLLVVIQLLLMLPVAWAEASLARLL